MNKIELCERFSEQLKEWRISHQVFNRGFHIQVQVIHNFYPTKQSYYNSESDDKCFYPNWKDVNDFQKWLGQKTIQEPKEISLPISEIIKQLRDCDHLDDAVSYFYELKNK